MGVTILVDDDRRPRGRDRAPGAVSIMAYHAGDAMIGTIAQTAARAKAVITALIAANP
jgi:hypothetical protein